MSKLKSLFAIGCLGVALSGCTALRPPSYNLPNAENIYPGEEYTVGRNENVYAIAQKRHVNMRDIIALNKLQPPFALRAGQVIILPAGETADGNAPTPKAAPLERIDKGYMAPTASGTGGAAPIVSSTSDVKAEELPPIAGTSASSGPLTAPSAAPATTSATTSKTTWASTPQPLPPAAPPTTPSAAPAPDLNAPMPPASSVSEPAAAAPATEPAAAQASTLNSNGVPAFGWPVRGTIISAFGPKGQGLDNDGINISAPKGSPVKAAAGGMVAYAGSEMKGFGNLVLIKHEGGWVTAYAHLDRLVVAKDSIVAKGDMIGTVGTSGGVSSPQLHFEARQDGKPVDPELVIK